MTEDQRVISSDHGCIGAHIVTHMCYNARHRGSGGSGVEVVIDCCNTTLCNQDMNGFVKRIEEDLSIYRPDNGKWQLVAVFKSGMLIGI